MPGMADHRVLADAPPEAIAALVQAAGPELVAVELRHLGGNLPVDGFSLFAIGVPMDAESAMAIDTALARVMEATAPFDSGRSLLNFSDRPAPARASVERPRRAPRGEAAGGWRRRVRRQPPASDLRRSGGQRERQRLRVGARAKRLVRADRLLEVDRRHVVADRTGVGQQRRRRGRAADVGEGRRAARDLQRRRQRERAVDERPVAVDDGSATLSVASPAVEIVVALVDAV